MYRNKTAQQHNFAIVPRADIPRSKFAMRQTRKMAFNASELVPIMVEEVLPGDTWSHKESVLARLATPIAPLMDDLDLETFYFFVPNRILWEPWEDFITGSDTALVVPGIAPVLVGTSTTTLNANSVFDHMGLLPQAYVPGLLVNVLPIWGYFTIWNEWFRDQNLQEPYTWLDTWTDAGSDNIGQDGAAANWNQACLRANKRHDIFTSSLPWPQKGPAVTLPLGSTAPIKTSATAQVTGAQAGIVFATAAGAVPAAGFSATIGAAGALQSSATALAGTGSLYPTNLYADLANATSATINAIRLAFQTQKLLERDARGGSRYVEQLLAHFGVQSPDYRLQRPEYLGGSKIAVTINPIAQTAQYEADPGTGTVQSALGNLGAEMHVSGSKHSFNYAAVEHGYIIGLALVRATPTYQQGTRKHWKRRTRLDFYFPAFAMLGEQAVKTTEIYQPIGTPTNDIWGYQEHWAEYRYTPNEITGVLRSTNPTPLDWWHLSEEFANEPALNSSFITDKTQEVLGRALATLPSEQWSAQILMDILHENTVARLMPMYSVPGLIDHF